MLEFGGKADLSASDYFVGGLFGIKSEHHMRAFSSLPS